MAAALSLGLAAAALAAFGGNKRGLDAALMLTGRWGFLLFWPAYAGAAMVSLFGPRFSFLKRHGRAFGLAFAAAMLVHAGLIVWLCSIGDAPAIAVFAFFGPALLCVYLLALFSLPALQCRLGHTTWWLLRTLAMNIIAYAFAADFLRGPFDGGLRHAVLYIPFAFLSVLGFAVYFAAQLRPMPKPLPAAR